MNWVKWLGNLYFYRKGTRLITTVSQRKNKSFLKNSIQGSYLCQKNNEIHFLYYHPGDF
jgi:hypothetical protein